jgi:hypothetical protein
MFTAPVGFDEQKILTVFERLGPIAGAGFGLIDATSFQFSRRPGLPLSGEFGSIVRRHKGKPSESQF